MIPYEDPTTLSRLYHLNSEPWLNKEAYATAAYRIDYKELSESSDRVALPAPQESTLLKLLKTRASCRRYNLQPMPLATLATLLGAAYGAGRIGTIPNGPKVLFRTVPSAGGLFPLELYVVTQSVIGIADGLHHYAVRRHCLELIKRGSLFAEQHGVLLADPFVRDANVVVFIAAVFGRTQKKYGPRGYRYILIEAGHVAQNLCLSATEQGLGSLCMGGFMDSKLNRFLGLDGVHEAAVYGVGIGYREESEERWESAPLQGQ